MKTLSRYRKSIVALIGAIATWATTYFPDDPSVAKVAGLVLAIVTTFSVFQIPNEAPAGTASDPAVSERGHMDVHLGVLLLIILVVSLLTTLAVISVWNVPHS